MASSFNRNQRMFLLPETTFGLCPTTAGAPNFAGADCALIVKAMFKPNVDLLVPQSKTGTRSLDKGVAGRRSGKWSIEVELRTAGTAGTVPDIDVLWQCAFGNTPTVVASTSVTYALTDNIKSFSVLSWRQPAAMAQHIAIGCVVTDVSITLGENIARAVFSGDCLWVMDSVTFSVTDTTGKGSVTTFPPAEPATPTTTGSIIAGFTGSASLDGSVLANIRNAAIKLSTGNVIPLDKFGSYYGGDPEGDVRTTTLAFSTYDDDAAAQDNLYVKAQSKAAINAIIQVGAVAGNIYTFNVKGVQLAVQDITEGARKWEANFSESRASGSTISALDELNAVLT